VDGDAPLPQLDALSPWEGLTVTHIDFSGVSTERLAPLPDHLALKIGSPLVREELQKSLRQLFATGVFETIRVEGEHTANGVTLHFLGTPNRFIGTVNVYGAKGGTLNAQLQRASQLTPGVRFTQIRLDQAIEQMRLTLADSGFH
jgi:outer membrane protein assembly factor BamA